jgi:hypothetical protein
VWGPGQRPDLALENFRRRIEAGQPVIIHGDGSQRWLKSESLNPKFKTKNTPPSPLFLFRLKFSAWNLGFSTTSTFHMIWMGVGGPEDWDALGNRFSHTGSDLRHGKRTFYHHSSRCSWDYMFV